MSRKDNPGDESCLGGFETQSCNQSQDLTDPMVTLSMQDWKPDQGWVKKMADNLGTEWQEQDLQVLGDEWSDRASLQQVYAFPRMVPCPLLRISTQARGAFSFPFSFPFSFLSFVSPSTFVFVLFQNRFFVFPLLNSSQNHPLNTPLATLYTKKNSSFPSHSLYPAYSSSALVSIRC